MKGLNQGKKVLLDTDSRISSGKGVGGSGLFETVSRLGEAVGNKSGR